MCFHGSYTLAVSYFLFKLSQACCWLVRGDQADPEALGKEQLLPLPLSHFWSKHTHRKPSCWVAGPQSGVPPGGSWLGAEEPRCPSSAVWTLGAPQWLPAACIVNVGLKEPPGPAVLSGAPGPLTPESRFDLLGAVGSRQFQTKG